MIDFLKTQGIDDYLMAIRYGSHNYNLGKNSSDTDYRVFITRTLKKTLCLQYENFDINVNHITKFRDSLINMEVKYVELLFSDKIIFNENIKQETSNLIKQLFNIKDKIVTMDIPQLYKQHTFEAKWQINQISKSKDLGELVSYMQHAYRLLDILERFSDSGFNDYAYAIKYKKDDKSKEMILDIKDCKLEKKEYEEIIKSKLERVIALEPCYLKFKRDTNTIKEVESIFNDIEVSCQWET